MRELLSNTVCHDGLNAYRDTQTGIEMKACSVFHSESNLVFRWLNSDMTKLIEERNVYRRTRGV